MAKPQAVETGSDQPAKVRGKKKAKLTDASIRNDAKLAGSPGHNSQVVPELLELMDEDLALDEKKKELGKAQLAIRNRVKAEFGVPKKTWNAEKALRKLDAEVRVQHEASLHDLKGMLGYQASLDLQPGTVARTEDEHADPSAAAGRLMQRH